MFFSSYYRELSTYHHRPCPVLSRHFNRSGGKCQGQICFSCLYLALQKCINDLNYVFDKLKSSNTLKRCFYIFESLKNQRMWKLKNLCQSHQSTSFSETVLVSYIQQVPALKLIGFILNCCPGFYQAIRLNCLIWNSALNFFSSFYSVWLLNFVGD